MLFKMKLLVLFLKNNMLRKTRLDHKITERRYFGKGFYMADRKTERTLIFQIFFLHVYLSDRHTFTTTIL